jgi:hypothetical protein
MSVYTNQFETVLVGSRRNLPLPWTLSIASNYQDLLKKRCGTPVNIPKIDSPNGMFTINGLSYQCRDISDALSILKDPQAFINDESFVLADAKTIVLILNVKKA